MGIFGWSYPPGAANDPNAPYNQTDDYPCDVCGQALDDCICPECPTCSEVGSPSCYAEHGLVRSFAQVALKAQAEECWQAEAEAIAKDEAAYAAEYVDGNKNADRIDGYDRDDLGLSNDY